MKRPLRDHDGGYKLLFSHPRMVGDLLKGFVREPWVGKLDFSTLDRVNPDRVSDDLKHRKGDVVWRLRVAGEDWLYVYLLLEFQSQLDRFMPVRVLTYVSLLYQDLLRRRELTPRGKLPPIIPLVLYNGQCRWRAPRRLSRLIEGVEGGLRAYQPEIRFLLVDEIGLPEKALARRCKLVSALFRLERSRQPNEVERIVADLARSLPEGQELPLRRALASWLARALGHFELRGL